MIAWMRWKDPEGEWILDPHNPRRASGPWGDKSVWEAPGYEPPGWLDWEPVGTPEPVTIATCPVRSIIMVVTLLR